MNETASCFLHGDFDAALRRCPKCGAGRGSDTTGAAARNSRPTTSGWIECPRCECQRHDIGSCGLCGNLGMLDQNADPLHCDCRADDWVEGDNGAIRCEQCGGYAGEPGTSIALVRAADTPERP